MWDSVMEDRVAAKDGKGWRKVLFEVIFEADTVAGKWFDVILILSIVASVIVVMLKSMKGVSDQYGGLLGGLEWFFTILFTVEYVLRLVCLNKPTRYARSFFGVVDLLAILPTYLSIVLPLGSHLMVVRLLRVLRIFRVLKFGGCVSEANMLMRALKASKRKIFVFLYTVVTLVIIIGALMYAIEGGDDTGFTSIPRSVYWAVVTLTTVGYGDISPSTPAGQFLAAMVMILGYSIIAVPTGIVTAEIAKADAKEVTGQVCPGCTLEGHDKNAVHCKYCGFKL